MSALSVLCLVVTLVISARYNERRLCFVFDCSVSDKRTLYLYFIVTLVMSAVSVLYLVVTLVISARYICTL